MILSKKTTDILKSFAMFNNAISVKAGNEITATQSDKYFQAQNSTVRAKATIDEVFPRDWCIYQLPDFLKLLDMYPNSDIEFEERSIKVTQGKVVTNYPYSIIHKQNFDRAEQGARKAPVTPNFAMTLVLTSKDIKHILKVAGTLNLDVFEVKENCIEIRSSVKSQNSPIQRIEGIETEGETLEGHPFLFNISVLKLLDNTDYELSLTKNSGLFTSLGESTVMYQISYIISKKETE